MVVFYRGDLDYHCLFPVPVLQFQLCSQEQLLQAEWFFRALRAGLVSAVNAHSEGLTPFKLRT